jgi:hypothetical protein
MASCALNLLWLSSNVLKTATVGPESCFSSSKRTDERFDLLCVVSLFLWVGLSGTRWSASCIVKYQNSSSQCDLQFLSWYSTKVSIGPFILLKFLEPPQIPRQHPLDVLHRVVERLWLPCRSLLMVELKAVQHCRMLAFTWQCNQSCSCSRKRRYLSMHQIVYRDTKRWLYFSLY